MIEKLVCSNQEFYLDSLVYKVGPTQMDLKLWELESLKKSGFVDKLLFGSSQKLSEGFWLSYAAIHCLPVFVYMTEWVVQQIQGLCDLVDNPIVSMTLEGRFPLLLGLTTQMELIDCLTMLDLAIDKCSLVPSQRPSFEIVGNRFNPTMKRFGYHDLDDSLSHCRVLC